MTRSIHAVHIHALLIKKEVILNNRYNAKPSQTKYSMSCLLLKFIKSF